MADPTSRQLIAAWLASSLVVPAFYALFVLAAAIVKGAPMMPWSQFALKFALISCCALVFQLIFGGAVYAVLRALGALSLTTLLLAYCVPLSLPYLLGGADRPEDFAKLAGQLAMVAAVVVVGWLFVRGSS